MSLKADTIKRVARFVIDNKNATLEERISLVSELTEDIVAQIVEAGGDRDRLSVWTMRHYDLLMKEDARMYSIADVLADFIMDIDQVGERSAEYPIYNAEKEYRDTEERKELELSVVAARESEDSGVRECPTKTKEGVISEDVVTVKNSVEDVLFEEPQMSADELKAKLSRIKEHPDGFVRKYADGSAWNRDDDSKRRTPINVIRAIERIELRRVRECIVCGNGYYSHSKQPGKQLMCDVMDHPEDKKMSFCQHTRDRMLSRVRKKRTGDRVIELNSSI